jgi:hypothetical protein
LILLIACLIGPAAFAATADDIGAAQSIIRAQEEAFARDDAPTAYSFAAPGIQSFYRSPDGFMYMVRNSYAPVYRHRSFVFGGPGSLTAKSSKRCRSSMPTASPGTRSIRSKRKPTAASRFPPAS